MSSNEEQQSIQPDTPASRRFFRRVRSAFLQFDLLYQLSLKCRFGAARLAKAPEVELPNCVLKSHAEWQEATRLGRERHEPLHRAPEKNWDHLKAVDALACRLPRTARIFDAGAELYSNVLPGLYAYGFRELWGVNLAFADPARRGSIRYQHGDITHTDFAKGYFDAATCMSVIEHGVPLEAYFREMFRILKPGGLLITSTDFYPEPINTRGLEAYGSPIKVYCRQEMEEMIELARKVGFETTGDIDWNCYEKPICWSQYELYFTFMIFTLRKPK